jgi:hypothetical protein
LGLDLTKGIGALEELKADVSFEELDCLGLEYNLDRLVATIKIKRPSGYSGDLCTQGSVEYVAFWSDWNNTCEWTYLNTVKVNVHDISSIPADGLYYSAILPVDTNPSLTGSLARKAPKKPASALCSRGIHRHPQLIPMPLPPGATCWMLISSFTRVTQLTPVRR